MDPVAPWEGASYRVNRGGSFNITADGARSACRSTDTPSSADANLGVRPARVLTE